MKFGGVRKCFRGLRRTDEMVYIDIEHPSDEAKGLIQSRSQDKYRYAEIEKEYPRKPHAKGEVKRFCYYATIAILVCMLLGQSARAAAYRRNNTVFAKEPTNIAMKVLGGDKRYLSVNKNIFSYGANELYRHMDNYGSGPITVAWSSRFSSKEEEQIRYVFDYLNDIFAVINPAVSFELKGAGQSANVEIEYKSGMQEYEIMETHSFSDFTSASRITRAKVYINEDYYLSDANMRFTLLHEAMHFLIGCDDFPEESFEQVSLMNYNDLSFVSSVVQYIETECAQQRMDYVPFTSLMPLDLASLIAVYGDVDNQENVKKYAHLINDTINVCERYLGEKEWLKDNNISRFFN